MREDLNGRTPCYLATNRLCAQPKSWNQVGSCHRAEDVDFRPDCSVIPQPFLSGCLLGSVARCVYDSGFLDLIDPRIRAIAICRR